MHAALLLAIGSWVRCRYLERGERLAQGGTATSA